MKSTSVLIVFLLLCSHGARAEDVAAARWFAEKPVVDAEGATVYVPAPDWIEIRGDGPEAVVTARITLTPETPEVWCQHAGAIAELQPVIPAGQHFRVEFEARSLGGAVSLRVLRRFGGFKRPLWEGFPLTTEWTNFSRDLSCEALPVDYLNFSLTEDPLGLRHLASGAFEIRNLSVTILPKNS
jgi:hypothetical protein